MNPLLCGYFDNHVCRSCQLLDQTYDLTLREKQQQVVRLFPAADVQPIVPTRNVPGSRIRARLAVFGSADQPRFGFLDGSRQIAEVDRCPLHHPRINALLELLPTVIRACRLVPYSMSDGTGELKFVVVTWSPSHQQLMVQLVLRSREAVSRIQRCWDSGGADELKDVSVFSVNIQPVRSSVINGPDEVPISACRRLPLRYGTTTVLYGPQSFIQTNYEIAEQIYRQAAETLSGLQPSRLLDLYSGTGAFSLIAAAAGIQVHGIDSVAESVNSARESALLNGLSDATFECCDVAASGWADDRGSTPDGGSTADGTADTGPSMMPDAVICNPPRRGLDEPARELLMQLRPQTVLYSSCSPETLRRDVSEMKSAFQIQQIRPFDMFPFTPHLELLALLTRT